VVPEFWSVERAHDVSEDVAARVIRDLGVEGEMVFHVDPCHRTYCEVCDLEDCPIRRKPFIKVTPLTLEEAVQPDMPKPALARITRERAPTRTPALPLAEGEGAILIPSPPEGESVHE
jgi:hypothetical protein